MSWSASSRISGRVPKTLIAVAVATATFSACGGDSSQPADTSTPPASNAGTQPTTEEPPTSEGPPDTPAESTDPEEPTASAGCSLDDFRDGDTVKEASCGGSATVILGGETVVFDSFACFTGADAIEATGSDRTTFTSIGVASHDGGLAAIVFSHRDVNITRYEIAYVPDVDSDVVWHGQATSGVVVVDGNQVSFEGEFEEVSGGDTATGGVEAGSVDATCAP